MTSPMAIGGTLVSAMRLTDVITGFDAVPATTRVQGRSTRLAFFLSDTRATLTPSAPLSR